MASHWMLVSLSSLLAIISAIFYIQRQTSRSEVRQAKPLDRLPEVLPKPTKKTYRVRGIPLNYNIAQAQACLNEILNKHGCDDPAVHVKSFAKAASGVDRVATFDISPDIDALLGEHKQQEFAYQGSARDGMSNDECIVTLDHHFLGFTPLYGINESTTDHLSIDIIALTGLGGHAFGSFKARKSNYMWLRDALGNRVPASRVWIYGYDSRVSESKSGQTITDLANAFVSSLATIINSSVHVGADSHSRASRQPLVLIGHSLGGLVIKQALVHLSKQPAEGKDIMGRLRGLLFFGVPNKVIEIESLLAMCHDRPNEYLLHTLDPKSEVLEMQQREFKQCTRDENLEVFCFYETKTSPTAIRNDQGKWVMQGPRRNLVNKTSAACFPEGYQSAGRLISVNTSHSDMVKFDRHDDTAESVFDILKLICDQAKNDNENSLGRLPSLSKEQEDCLKTVAFEAMDFRERSVEPGYVGSGSWLSEIPMYQQWKRSGASLLSLRGHPGVGKSTLMKSIASESHQNVRNLTLSFFFHGQGSGYQKSEAGMIRSLFHQLARQCPVLAEELFSLYEERNKTFGPYGNRWSWTDVELKELFDKTLMEAGKNLAIEIFVDALDEAGERAAFDVVKGLKQTVDAAKTFKLQIRVIFSCRYFPSIPIASELEIHVQTYNRSDVDNYIRSSLEQERVHQLSVNTLVYLIMDRADGNFQWAKIVLDEILQRLLSSSTSVKNLQKIITGIPNDLKALYSRLLDGVDEDDRIDCIRIFQWVAFAACPLELAEVQIALMLSTPVATLQGLRDHEDFIDDLTHLHHRIRALSKGLITIDTTRNRSVVRFTHQSVQDFVVSEGLANLQGLGSEEISSGAHHQLYRCCIRYLKFHEVYDFCQVDSSSLVHNMWSSDTRRKFPLINYALQYWAYHLEKAEGHDLVSHSSLLRDFDHVSRNVFEAWIRLNLLQRIKPFADGNTNVAHPLAAIGCEAVFLISGFGNSALLQEIDICGRTPFLWASERGHVSIVKLLIRQEGTDINLQDQNGHTALWLAAYEGHDEIVKLLLQADQIKINLSDCMLQTPLHIAVACGHVGVIKQLIKANPGGIDMMDGLLKTPLYLAADHVHFEVVKILLDTGRVNVNACNHDGDSPLWAAASRGSVEIMKLLLETGRADADLHNRHEQGPLYAAAVNNKAEAVKVLLSTGQVDVFSCDIFNNTALFVATRNAYVDVMRPILDHLTRTSALGAEYQHILLLAAAERDKSEAMELLVGHYAFGVNVLDDEGRSVLSYVAENGGLDTIRYLLTRTDIIVDRGDERGKTPIMYAFEAGHFRIVHALEEKGARIDEYLGLASFDT